jgi:hypothetical protein
MTIKTEKYTDAVVRWPKAGKHIMAQVNGNAIVLYQAYNAAIADYAVTHQKLGGPGFSYDRMSWVKPNFLWMMYRCGWAAKENQERVLAIHLALSEFDEILANAVFSTFRHHTYATRKDWEEDVKKSQVRLQWDPDHDPYGNKQERKAIQLGLRGNTFRVFGQNNIQHIEDITPFVKEQRAQLSAGNIRELLVPVEDPYVPVDQFICRRIELAE